MKTKKEITKSSCTALATIPESIVELFNDGIMSDNKIIKTKLSDNEEDVIIDIDDYRDLQISYYKSVILSMSNAITTLTESASTMASLLGWKLVNGKYVSPIYTKKCEQLNEALKIN